jgi:hypothetical protein
MYTWLLAGTIVIALVLRLWGIGWGLPNQQRIFSLHPDEGVNLIEGVLDEGNVKAHLNLRLYNYGTLYFYMWQVAAEVNKTYSFANLPRTDEPTYNTPLSPASVILCGRLISCLFGALTSLMVYLLATRLFGKRAGLIAAGLHAIFPLAVLNAHYATVDATACFFVAGALWAAVRALDAPSHQNWLIAGVWVGLSAATKYNAILVGLAPITCLILMWRTDKRLPLVNAGLLVLGLLLAFFLTCPAPLLDSAEFWKDVTYEIGKSQQGMGYLFADTGLGWWYHLNMSLRIGLGVPLLLLSLGGLIYSFVAHRRQDAPLLAFLVAYYGVIGFAQVRFARYVLPLLPAFSVLAARLLTTTPSRTGWRRAMAAAGGIIAILGTLNAISFDTLATGSDVREKALEFIQRNVPQGSDIAFATTPWYDCPPLSTGFTLPGAPSRRQSALNVKEYSLRVPAPNTEYDLTVLDPAPACVITTDIGSADALRIGLPNAVTFFDRLKQTHVPFTFATTRTILGVGILKPAHLPNDLLYMQPTVTVYLRKDLAASVQSTP